MGNNRFNKCKYDPNFYLPNCTNSTVITQQRGCGKCNRTSNCSYCTFNQGNELCYGETPCNWTMTNTLKSFKDEYGTPCQDNCCE